MSHQMMALNPISILNAEEEKNEISHYFIEIKIICIYSPVQYL
jgi:hypothetical protein